MIDIIFFLVFVLFILMVIALINKLCHQKEDEVLYIPKKEEEELPPLNFPARKIERKNMEKQTTAALEQRKLVTQYVNSELLKQILNYICDGNYKIYKPREIIINHENITADVSGKRIVYDFASNRVPVFKQIFFLIDEKKSEKDIVKPQVAMAEAINMLMEYEYEIIDKRVLNWRTVHHHDGEIETVIDYESNYVLMRLKATKQF